MESSHLRVLPDVENPQWYLHSSGQNTTKRQCDSLAITAACIASNVDALYKPEVESRDLSSLVETDHSVPMTVHKCHTQHGTKQFRLNSFLSTRPITVQMVSIGRNGIITTTTETRVIIIIIIIIKKLVRGMLCGNR